MMITCIFSLLHNSMYKIKLWQQNLNWRNQSTRLSVEGSMYNNVMIVVNYGKYIPPKVRLLRDVGWPAQCQTQCSTPPLLHDTSTWQLCCVRDIGWCCHLCGRKCSNFSRATRGKWPKTLHLGIRHGDTHACKPRSWHATHIAEGCAKWICTINCTCSTYLEMLPNDCENTRLKMFINLLLSPGAKFVSSLLGSGSLRRHQQGAVHFESA